MFPTKRDRERVAEEINRDYPHQVALPLLLDDDTEEDLIWWLDRRIGRWDVYVDLNNRFVRYCFFEEKDASAFRLRFVAGMIKAVS
jgi:hypothetical protein